MHQQPRSTTVNVPSHPVPDRNETGIGRNILGGAGILLEIITIVCFCLDIPGIWDALIVSSLISRCKYTYTFMQTTHTHTYSYKTGL